MVKDAMVHRVILVSPRTHIQEAALIISQSTIDVLVVSEGGTILGVVNERDILAGALAESERHVKAVVADVMSRELTWLLQSEDLVSAKSRLRAGRVALVKDSNHKLVGTLWLD